MLSNIAPCGATETPFTTTATITFSPDTFRAPHAPAAPPELVSQKNSLACTGLPPRQYLEQVRAFRRSGGEVFDVGKLRLVDRIAFVAWLKSTSKPATHETDGADGVLAELGLVRTGAPR